MADIAQLGIAIDSTAAAQAAKDLDSFTASASSAATANEALARSSSSAGNAQAGIATSSAAASDTVSRASDRLLASLEKQIALFGATEQAVAHYNGALAQMTAVELEHYKAQTNVLSQLQAEAAQLQTFYAEQERAVAAGQRFIASLTTQAETIGLNKTQLLEYKAAQLGVSEQAAPLIASIESQTKAMQDSAVAAVALGESEEAATLRIKEAIAASLAQADASNDNTIALERYAASVEEVAAAATAAERAQGGLAEAAEVTANAYKASAAEIVQAAESIGVASTTVSAGAEKIINSIERQIIALTAGKAALAEYDAQLAGLSQAEVALVAEKAAELEATQKQVALGAQLAKGYQETAAGARVLGGGVSSVTSELAVLAREAGRGDYNRLAGSFTRLLSLAGALQLIFNPLSLTLIAVGAAFVKVEEEDSKLNQALELTGGYVGETASSLRLLAGSISEGGATIGVATEAVTALAASGRITSDEIAKVGQATADAATYTSVSVKEMVADFTKLQEEPLKASIKLNEQYHYLTVATYDQIAALEKQGLTTEAAKVAVDAFADETERRTQDIAKNEGVILKGWQDIKSAISGALEFVGRFGAAAGPEEVVARLQANKAARLPIGQWSTEDQAELDKATQAAQAAILKAKQEGDQKAHEQDVIAAKERLATLEKEFATPAQKRAKEIEQLLNDAALAGTSPEKQLDLEEQINQKYRDRKVAIDRLPRAQDQTRISELKSAYQEEESAFKAHQKEIEDDHRAGITSDGVYYDLQRALIAQNLQDTLDYYKRLQAAIKAGEKDDTPVQRQKDEAAIRKVQADAVTAVNNAQAEKIKLDDAEKASADKRNASIKAYNDLLKEQLETQRNAADLQVSAIGQGSRESGLEQQINAAQKAYEKQAAALEKTFASSHRTEDDKKDYDSRLAAQQKFRDETIALDKETFDRLTAAQHDWTRGANKAWEDWYDGANNVAGQINSTFTTTFNGLTDVLTTFVTTGKLSFTSLADSIIKDLVRIATQYAESQALKAILGLIGSVGGAAVGGAAGGAGSIQFGGTGSAFGGSASAIASSGVSTGFSNPGGLGYATGGFIEGPGSGTSDSINAKLSNGEFVVNAAATSKNRALLEAMNGGAKSQPGKTHFADGGAVGTQQPGAAGTQITFNIGSQDKGSSNDISKSADSQAGKKNSATFQKELEAAVIEVVRKHSQPGGTINKIVKTIK